MALREMAGESGNVTGNSLTNRGLFRAAQLNDQHADHRQQRHAAG